MKDTDCVRFLQWFLPQNHMCWQGFRKVRGQVCKRIAKHLEQLQLHNIDAYQDYLLQQPQEWQNLDKLCRVTISRFYRDKLVFNQLAERVLPTLAARSQETGDKTVRVWSIGCSSGEEPYTLTIIWQHLLEQYFPAVQLSVLASEADPCLLERCRRACYSASSIKNLPDTLCSAAFTTIGREYCLKQKYKLAVEFVRQDIRKAMPEEQFDLILCRNLVFTYFDEELQRKILHELYCHLNQHGWLVLGVHEKLPRAGNEFIVASERLGLYQK